MSTTVIIVNWNGCDLLEECLRSLESQTKPADEIIVVDNGSRDGSIKLLESTFQYVKLIKLPHNLGFAKANNIGFSKVTGNRIALLNNDTIAHPNWLENMNKALDNHPEAGFCASKLLLYSRPEIIDTVGDFLGVARAFKRGHMEADCPAYNTQEYVFSACAGAAIYRKQMLDSIGLFDEDFVTDFEDVDLGYRAQLAGYKCLFVPDAIVYHRLGETKKRIKWDAEIPGRKNKKLLWFKNTPGALLLKYFPYYFFKECLDLLKCFRFPKYNMHRLYVILASYYKFFKLFPKMLAKRRKIQQKRTVSDNYIDSLIVKPTPLIIRPKPK